MRRGSRERELFKAGVRVVGVDEVGRGCLAGPVYAACVGLDYNRFLRHRGRSRFRDSKKISQKERQSLIPAIIDLSLDAHVGIASVEDIERLGIVEATFLAMRRALKQCRSQYDLLLVDGKLHVTGCDLPQETIIGGDDNVYAIAAASILAKEARDEFMRAQAITYPNYGFATNVGYGTKEHLEGISQHGICSLHRRNFAPIRSAESTLF